MADRRGNCHLCGSSLVSEFFRCQLFLEVKALGLCETAPCPVIVVPAGEKAGVPPVAASHPPNAAARSKSSQAFIYLQEISDLFKCLKHDMHRSFATPEQTSPLPCPPCSFSGGPLCFSCCAVRRIGDMLDEGESCDLRCFSINFQCFQKNFNEFQGS